MEPTTVVVSSPESSSNAADAIEAQALGRIEATIQAILQQLTALAVQVSDLRAEVAELNQGQAQMMTTLEALAEEVEATAEATEEVAEEATEEPELVTVEVESEPVVASEADQEKPDSISQPARNPLASILLNPLL